MTGYLSTFQEGNSAGNYMLEPKCPTLHLCIELKFILQVLWPGQSESYGDFSDELNLASIYFVCFSYFELGSFISSEQISETPVQVFYSNLACKKANEMLKKHSSFRRCCLFTATRNDYHQLSVVRKRCIHELLLCDTKTDKQNLNFHTKWRIFDIFKAKFYYYPREDFLSSTNSSYCKRTKEQLPGV